MIQSTFDLKNQQKSKMDYLNIESKTLDFQIQIKLFEQLVPSSVIKVFYILYESLYIFIWNIETIVIVIIIIFKSYKNYNIHTVFSL